jgi:hypothetical protein
MLSYALFLLKQKQAKTAQQSLYLEKTNPYPKQRTAASQFFLVPYCFVSASRSSFVSA